MLTILVLAPGLMLFTARVSETAPMGTAITYQGRLMEERVGRRMDSTILSSNYSTPIKWVIREVGFGIQAGSIRCGTLTIRTLTFLRKSPRKTRATLVFWVGGALMAFRTVRRHAIRFSPRWFPVCGAVLFVKSAMPCMCTLVPVLFRTAHGVIPTMIFLLRLRSRMRGAAIPI